MNNTIIVLYTSVSRESQIKVRYGFAQQNVSIFVLTIQTAESSLTLLLHFFGAVCESSFFVSLIITHICLPNIPTHTCTHTRTHMKSRWVQRQRHQRKLKEKGLDSTLIDKRETMLTNAGFIWNAHEALWQEKYQRLESYRQQHGHCDVPSDYHDTSFVNWVKNQRRQYKRIHVVLRTTTIPPRSHDQHENDDHHSNNTTPNSRHQQCSNENTDTRKNTLNPNRIELLNSIGFNWNPRRHKTWNSSRR